MAGWRDEPARRSKEWRFGTEWERLLKRRKRTTWVNFFWISPGPLLASVNDKIAKGLDDLVNEVRPRWVAAQRAAGRLDRGLAVRDHADKERLAFLVLGDPGEQDASQYAVVEPLLAVGADTDFMLIDSDVIYPAGDINDYIDGFYLPYERYRGPIYAIPGNHDWYDGLNGFMFHFCGAEPLPSSAYRAGSYNWKERLARALWRKPSPPDLPVLLYERRARATIEQQGVDAAWEPAQPGPYFTIETETLLIVCIDTGITGRLDREQGDWLRDVSRDPRPKLLVTGKPIYVDGEYHSGEIDWGPSSYPGIDQAVGGLRTVDDIVRKPEHRYVAVIGGDVHNYQRYSVLLSDEGPASEDLPQGPPPRPDTPPHLLRRIEYVVSGGGGAYLSATHRFGRVQLDPAAPPKKGHKPLPSNIAPIDETAFWCYPLRGDSLARFVRRFAPGFGIAFAGAALILAIYFAVFIWPGDGWQQPLDSLSDAQASNAIWVVPLTLGLAAGLVFGAVKASNWLAPPGFRTLGATTLVAAGGVLLVFGGNLLGEAWDEWIWRLAVSSLIAVALPALGVVVYYLLRDFIPQSVRTGIGIAIGLAVAAALIGSELTFDAAEPLLVGVALALLWLSVLGLGRLQRLPDDPQRREDPGTRARVLLGRRLIPIAVGLVGLAVALAAALVHLQDTGWLITGALTAFLCIVFLVAAALLITGFRALGALPWLLAADVDPDMTANWLAQKLGMEPVHASARTAKPDRKTEALAGLTYSSRPYSEVMSELAEATTPPFFKSFIRVEVDAQELRITAYGVTGWRDDETAPTKEDEVTIPL
jgi:Calcineurin-like phosphoesterase